MGQDAREFEGGFTDFARLVIDALEAAEITYLIGSAVAVWAWGEPRTTQDFDLVIELPGTRIITLSDELKKRRMLAPADILLDLLLREEGDLPVSAIHLDSGYKAELFLLRPGDEFRETALKRRRPIDFGPPLNSVFVHTPEDLVLNKAAYYKLSQQTKHIRDFASILTALTGDEFDWTYFDHWLHRLNLEPIWLVMQPEVNRLIPD